MDLSILEIYGVLAEDESGLLWLKILDIYRTEDGLVIKIELPKKKKPIVMSMGHDDPTRYQEDGN